MPTPASTFAPLADPLPPPPRAIPASTPGPIHASGHNLLWMAAMNALPLPADVADALRGVPRTGLAAASKNPRGSASSTVRYLEVSRWSGDAWLAWRTGRAALGASGSAVPVYGGSQAGGVLSYRLAPQSPHDPRFYARGVSALGAASDTDLAFGGSLRPLAHLPLTAHAEVRASARGGGRTEVRPAAFVAGGIDDTRLAKGVDLRGYAQAGVVGGREPTAFADGALALIHPLRARDTSRIDAGAGAWAGVQRGAGRLDIGPTASLRFRLGEGAGRVAIDYRLRIAGNAAPAAGAALTLSAGF